MIGFKEPEVLFHTAALGNTGTLGTELDYRDTDGGLMPFALTLSLTIF